MNAEITPEVCTLVDRIAAAFYRGEPNYARELVAKFSKQCEAAGRTAEQSDIATIRDRELEYAREATVIFRTRDGLEARDTIRDLSYWPPEIRRPTASLSVGVEFSNAMLTSMSTRRYEKAHRTREGLIVYVEAL